MHSAEGRIAIVHLKCREWPHSAVVDGGDLEARIHEALTMRTIPELFGLLRCANFGLKKIAISDERSRLLVDLENLTLCQVCGKPIPLPRLAALPQTRACAAHAEDAERPPQPPPHLRRCPWPNCRKPTEVRENRTTGERYVGCTGYPRCRWTSDLPG